MGLDIEDFNTPEHRDFRRANGAPQVVDKEGKNQRLSRPSGWGKVLDDENALVNWKIDTAIKGVAQDEALRARAMAVKDDDRSTKSSIREAAIQAGRGNQASDIGTALHAMSERWEQEPDFDPGSPYRESLEAYSKEMERLALATELFEYHVVNLEYRAAGTCDRLYRLTKPLMTPKGEMLDVGTLIVGDLKTGKKLDFSLPGYTVQMALYAQGEMYDVVSDQFRPTPPINQDWGLLVHMPADKAECNIQWIDLAVGNYGAYLVHEIRGWRKDWRSGAYAAPVVDTPALDIAEIAEELNAEIVAEGDEYWVEMMLPFARARIKSLRDHPSATKQLLTFWPDEVPAPKDISEPEHLTLVLDLLDKIEAEHGLTFPEGDPRDTPGAHKSVGPHSNAQGETS